MAYQSISQRAAPKAARSNAAPSIHSTQGMWSSVFDDIKSTVGGNNSPFDTVCASRESASPVVKPLTHVPPTFSIRARCSSPRLSRDEKGPMPAKRRTYVPRRANRAEHSTGKLFLSRRMVHVIKASSVKLSPIKPQILAPDFENAGILRIIRKTRDGIIICPE